MGLYLMLCGTKQFKHPRELPDTSRMQFFYIRTQATKITGAIAMPTNSRFSQAGSISVAMQQVKDWLSCSAAWVPMPSERHADLLDDMLRHVTSPYVVPDAHLAALAIEHGLTLCSADGDFARFPGLRWENPLARSGK